MIVSPANTIESIYFQKYSSSFSHVVESANGRAGKLLELIVTDFPSLRDTAVYNGQKSIFKSNKFSHTPHPPPPDLEV